MSLWWLMTRDRKLNKNNLRVRMVTGISFKKKKMTKRMISQKLHKR